MDPIEKANEERRKLGKEAAKTAQQNEAKMDKLYEKFLRDSKLLFKKHRIYTKSQKIKIGKGYIVTRIRLYNSWWDRFNKPDNAYIFEIEFDKRKNQGWVKNKYGDGGAFVTTDQCFNIIAKDQAKYGWIK